MLKTEHFDIHFYPEEEAAARMTARMAERWYARLSKLLNHELRGRQPVILYASAPHFWQTTALEGDMGEGTGGVTEAYKRRIVLPLAGPIHLTDHVFGHELVHAFQYDITNTNVSSGNGGALNLPLWFIEGMAEYLSIGPVDPHTSMWMREAARREKLPDIDQLDDPRYFPYRYGQAFWAYVAGRFGDEVIGDMLRAGGLSRGGYEVAIEGVLQVKSKDLSKEWHEALFTAYRPIAETTKMPSAVARPVVKKRREGELNVSPELSPDGSKVVFFSERDLFSIDLYVADTKTGEVLRKITDTATSAHTESLQFIASAGAWDQSGKKYVFPGIARGQAVLTIVDVERAKKEREIAIAGVDEVQNPTWSPDGNSIAFSGLAGGFNDLFVYDLTSSQLRRLTTDQFAELAPAWSPDGKLLAFSTDRFTTDLQNLVAGDFRLAVLDLASGTVRPAGGFEHAKNIDPQWSADGKALYFVSDRGGISNIYRTEIGGATTQLTNFLTGASGITELSPALSVAGNRLVFSAFEDNGYTIYALETPEQLAGGAAAEPADECGGAAAAPRGRRPGVHAAAERHARPAAGDRRGDPRRGIQAQARDRLRGPAGHRRRQGSVRHLRRRRRVVRVQRHARQPLAVYRRAGHQPVRRVRRHRGLHQPHASLELGRLGRSDAVRLAQLHGRCERVAGRAGLRRGRVPDPPDRSLRLGSDLVSVQPRDAGRLQRRRSEYRVQAGHHQPDLRLQQRPADRGGRDGGPVARRSDAR